MKKLLLGLMLVGGFAFSSAQKISLDKTTEDYGTIGRGSEGHRYFTVTNKGDKPLILTNVSASCGCTKPEWSKDPILPGKSTKIKVGYDTTIGGAFTKNIEIYSNDPDSQRTLIYIKGNVDPSLDKDGKKIKS